MKKKTQSISINVVSAMVILLCLLITIIQPVNAWFSSNHENGVQISVMVGNLNLKLYQGETEIKTNDKNATGSEKSYINLSQSQKIMPDTNVSLELVLRNEDEGALGLHIRFKFEIYKRGYESDTLIDANITAGSDFTKQDDYYVYTKGTGSSVELAKGDSTTLMTAFQIPMTAFVGDSDNMIIQDSSTIYIKLTIEGSTSSY